MTISSMYTLLSTAVLAAAADPSGLTLSGVVHNDKGQPLAGATVFISTAAPRQGVGVL